MRRFHLLLDKVEQDFLFAGEVVVKRGFTHSDSLGYLTHRCFVETLLYKELSCDLEDAMTYPMPHFFGNGNPSWHSLSSYKFRPLVASSLPYLTEFYNFDSDSCLTSSTSHVTGEAQEVALWFSTAS